MTNRFRGSDLIDRVPEELWMGVRDIVQEEVIKTIPKKRKCTGQKHPLPTTQEKTLHMDIIRWSVSK